MPGLAEPLSVLALGTAGLSTPELADPVLDAYAEAGGNLIDTAWHYLQGQCEQVFADWLHRRHLAGKLGIIAKGAHTPHCNPAAIGRQLDETLARLRLDTVDIYMMHRDDPAVPVGEFVDAILAEVDAGRIASWGFSNWTIARTDAAIAHARRQGGRPPRAISNNFSLAEMIEPVWAGCVAARDAAWHTRLAQGDLGLYAWSSQARGFFAGRRADEIDRCWSSPKNLERRARAASLAEQRHTDANRVALAWTLAQNLPVIPLIGPLSEAELQSSLDTLDIALTPDEVAWLDTGAPTGPAG